MPNRLIDELVRRTSIQESERDAILARQQTAGGCIDTAILELELAGEAEILPALGSAYGFATAGAGDTTAGIEPSIFRRFPEQLALKHSWAPLEFEENQSTLRILCTAPPNLKALREVGALLELKLKPVLTTEIRVQQRQALLYDHSPGARILDLLNAAGGLGDEAIQAPSKQEDNTRASLLQSQPLTFAEATRQLLEAQTRDEIVDIALYYAHRSFSYVALLAVKKARINGWRAIGPSHTKIENLDIDPQKASSFGTAFETSAQVLGSPKREDQEYLVQMGRKTTRSLLIIPLRLNEKIFALLYADNDSSAISPHLAADMMVFGHHVQKAMERIILQRKGVKPEKDALPIPPLAEASDKPNNTKAKEEAKPAKLAAKPITKRIPTPVLEPMEELAPIPRPISKPRLKPLPELKKIQTPTVSEQVVASPAQVESPATEELAEQDAQTDDDNFSDTGWEAELEAILEENEQESVLPPFSNPPRAVSKSELPPFDLPGFPSSVATASSLPKIEEREEPARTSNKAIPVLPSLIKNDRVPSSPLLQAAPPLGGSPRPLNTEFQDQATPSDFALRHLSFDASGESTSTAERPKSFDAAKEVTESNGFVIPDGDRSELLQSSSDTPIVNAQALENPEPSEETPARATEPYSLPGEAIEAPETEEEAADKTLIQERPTDLDELSAELIEPAPEPTEVEEQENTLENSDTLLNIAPVIFAPSMAEIKEWILALSDNDPLTRKQALDSPIAKEEQVLPLLKDIFPGVLDVDPMTAGLSLPPFSECGSLLKVFSEFGLLAHPYVEAFMDTAAMHERFFATYFYSECYVPKMIPKLIRRLHDGDPRISVAAENSLFQYRADPAFDMVIKHLHDRLRGTSVEARKRAITCLATFREARAVEPLIAVLGKNEKPTSSAALVALEEITRQSWGLNIKKWKAWWSKNQNKTRTEWLVDALESKDLNIREKTITELEELSGETFDYFPGGSRWKRSKAVSRWRTWIKESGGQIKRA